MVDFFIMQKLNKHPRIEDRQTRDIQDTGQRARADEVEANDVEVVIQTSATSSIGDGLHKTSKAPKCTVHFTAQPQSLSVTEDHKNRRQPITSNGTASSSMRQDVTTKKKHLAGLEGLPINKNFQSRLEGLKAFKEWNNTLNEVAEQHRQNLEKIRMENTETIRVLDQGLTHLSLTSVEFCEKPVDESLKLEAGHNSLIPMVGDSETNTSSMNLRIVPALINTAVPDTWPGQCPPLKHTAATGLVVNTSEINSERRYSGSKASADSSISIEKFKDLSVSRSKSHFQRREKSRSSQYPPVSFPTSFNEQANARKLNCSLSSSKQSQPNADPRAVTPSISPLTRPEPACSQPERDNLEFYPTAHDENGRLTFYSTIHYYTECPHTCPPATRPLHPNAQPRPDSNSGSSNSEVVRSIIPGSCFNCDTFCRRVRENQILDMCNVSVIKLKSELAGLVSQLEVLWHKPIDDEKALVFLHTPSELPENNFAAQHQRNRLHSSPLSHKHVSEIQSSKPWHMTAAQRAHQLQIAHQIRKVEAAIDILREDQDARVRMVWQGYTQRWGPATLGIQLRLSLNDSTRCQTQSNSGYNINQHCDPFPDTCNSEKRDDNESDMQVSSIANGSNEDRHSVSMRISVSGTEGNSVTSQEQMLCDGKKSRSRSRSAKRGRAAEWNSTPTTERDLTATSSANSYRDPPGSRSPGDGRMRVGWIRENT